MRKKFGFRLQEAEEQTDNSLEPSFDQQSKNKEQLENNIFTAF